MVLTVIVLAEDNSPVDPNLAQKANAINAQAKNLSGIARRLGGSNYKDFPIIHMSIAESSNAVDEATITMANAIHVLLRKSYYYMIIN